MTGPGRRRPMLAVAHRAANSRTDLRAALDAGVDLVEADVHTFRGGLEIRHLKTLGPRLLWDRWELRRRRDLILPTLRELLAEPGCAPRLMLDLKGVHPTLAPALAATLRESMPGVPVTICTQHWWMLDTFAAEPQVRLILSAGSRHGLHRLRRRLSQRPAYGVAVHQRLLTAAIVDELRSAAPVVLTWPVDTPEALADARWLGVTGVISKDLRLLAGVLSDR
ncbi:MAG TPA: glycerophosphodiester phosphodiesterase [Mycobacteriales bacterium]|nr:glycerophosphodiester phosphodiesterase [Mycobacteriales bacterium]